MLKVLAWGIVFGGFSLSLGATIYVLPTLAIWYFFGPLNGVDYNNEQFVNRLFWISVSVYGGGFIIGIFRGVIGIFIDRALNAKESNSQEHDT